MNSPKFFLKMADGIKPLFVVIDEEDFCMGEGYEIPDAIASARNMMVYRDKLTLKWTVFFIVLSVVLGLMVNTMGFIGLLPIIAIVQITICNYALKQIKWIKLSFIVNEFFYVVYFIAILDFSSSIIETITAVIGLVSFFKLIWDENHTNAR